MPYINLWMTFKTAYSQGTKLNNKPIKKKKKQGQKEDLQEKGFQRGMEAAQGWEVVVPYHKRKPS